MTVWELPVLCMVSVLGGIKGICGMKLWKGEEFSLTGVWRDKWLYVLGGIWLVLYGFLWFGMGKSPFVIRMADLLCTYGILAAVDGRRRIVPDEILFCYFAGQMLFGALTMPVAGLFRIMLTGGIFAAVTGIVAWCSRGKMGMGDVKLLGVTAMTAGWDFAFQLLVLAILFSFVYSIWLLAVRKSSIRTEFPFVPFLTAGAVALVLLLL